MSLYVFEVSNSFQDQEFMLEADDLVSAHMKAMDFARKLDQKIKQEFGAEDGTEVVSVTRVGMLRADEAGANQYIEAVKVCCEDEDE